MLQLYVAMVSDEGEKSIIEFIYTNYRQMMYKTAFDILKNKENAEDAVHDAFLRVVKNVSKFRKYSCNQNAAYLVIIVRGIALNMLNKNNKVSELDDSFPDEECVEEKALANVNYEQIVQNIGSLSPALKDIAYLHFVSELSPIEISELLNMNLNTVHSSIRRAKMILSNKCKENQ